MTAVAHSEDVADSRKLGTDLGDAKRFRDRSAFAAQVAALRAGGGTLNLSEKTLMVAGGIIAPLGLVVVLLGWAGASRTSNLFEQIPYMISGGLFGLGLVFLGAFFYFAHWMTELVKESRAQSTAMIDAIARLEATVKESAVAAPGAAPSRPAAAMAITEAVPAVDADTGEGADEGVELFVATAKGSMAHLPECIVVAGKPGLRSVRAGDGLKPCKMCEPFST